MVPFCTWALFLRSRSLKMCPFFETSILEIWKLLRVHHPSAELPCQWVKGWVYSLKRLDSGHATLVRDEEVTCEWFPIDSVAYHILGAPYVYCWKGNKILNTHMKGRQRRAAMIGGGW